MAERQDFLARPYVAVLGVARDGKGPMLAPVWYEYDAESGFRVQMDAMSAKVGRLRAAGRATVCVQDDRDRYVVVTAEGPVELTVLSREDALTNIRRLAARYLGEDQADGYAAAFPDRESLVVRLRPATWISQEFGASGR